MKPGFALQRELNVAKSQFDFAIRQVERAQLDYNKKLTLNNHRDALTHLQEMSLETTRLTEELLAGCKRIEMLEEQWRKQIRRLEVSSEQFNTLLSDADTCQEPGPHHDDRYTRPYITHHRDKS